MYSQTLLTTSPRGSGSGPTTAASASDGCSGRCNAFALPLLAVALLGFSCDVLVGIVHLRFASPFLHAVERQAAAATLACIVALYHIETGIPDNSADHRRALISPLKKSDPVCQKSKHFRHSCRHDTCAS